MGRLHWEDIPFERLDVTPSVADNIFRDDQFKRLQIPAIAEKSRQRKAAAQASAAAAAAAEDGKNAESSLSLGPFEPEATITCYRMGDHVDISSGKVEQTR